MLARMKRNLLIVDAFSILFRSHYAMEAEPLTRLVDGKVISGLAGFCNQLFRALREVQPSHLVVALDSPIHTLRKRIFPTYKANRGPVNDVSCTNLPLLLSLRSFCLGGFRAV